MEQMKKLNTDKLRDATAVTVYASSIPDMLHEAGHGFIFEGQSYFSKIKTKQALDDAEREVSDKSLSTQTGLTNESNATMPASSPAHALCTLSVSNSAMMVAGFFSFLTQTVKEMTRYGMPAKEATILAA